MGSLSVLIRAHLWFLSKHVARMQRQRSAGEFCAGRPHPRISLRSVGLPPWIRHGL